jgi:hypothetical protein
MVTAQQLNKYFEQYASVEITFTKRVTEVLRLVAKHVYLKVQADILQCIIYSTSMREAKVIASLRASALRAIQKENSTVSLRFCFAQADRANSFSFYVSAKVNGCYAYNAKAPGMYLLSLEYTNRPPDDLIELLGELLEANVNAKRRKEARIDITPASTKALGLESKEAALAVGGVEHRCLLRDLSFSGAKVLVYGQATALVDQPVVLRLNLTDESRPVLLPGKVLRFETVANREDIGAVAILFEEQKVPMPYKMAINNYLRSHRYALPSEKQPEQAAAQPPEPIAQPPEPIAQPPEPIAQPPEQAPAPASERVGDGP